MKNNKYGNFLTIALVVLIIAIIGIIGFFTYQLFVEKEIEDNADAAVEEFKDSITKKHVSANNKNEVNNEIVYSSDEVQNLIAEMNESNVNLNTNTNDSDSNDDKVTLEGYEVIGTIKIPKTGIEYPILNVPGIGVRSLEIAVVTDSTMNGVGLNEPGNVTIFGHNYRNGKFFSNNKKLSNGDKIYITDKNNNTVTYEIYNIYQTDFSDGSYIRRDTEGRREISLQTCTDDSGSNQRLIIWATAD